MAIDRKYGRVELEHSTVGEDEPVFVFRAQDRLLIKVLDHYLTYCRLYGSSQAHLDSIEAAMKAISDWQWTHQTKLPTSEALVNRDASE